MPTTTCQFCSVALAHGRVTLCCAAGTRDRALRILADETDEEVREGKREVFALIVGDISNEDLVAVVYEREYAEAVAAIQAAHDRMRALAKEYGDGLYDARRTRALESLDAALAVVGEEWDG